MALSFAGGVLGLLAFYVSLQHCLSKSSAVRLVDGQSNLEGRVELLHDGKWGTLCGFAFDDIDATVICKMLGYDDTIGNAKAMKNFGGGTGPIWFDDPYCKGTEADIADCPRVFKTAVPSWGTNSCQHDEDVGVRCAKSSAVRLVDGQSNLEGRVELLHDGKWGTLCDHYFDDIDATVICRMLGYDDTPGNAKAVKYFGGGTGPIWFADPECKGTEADIGDCPRMFKTAVPVWGINYCQHSEDVGVRCEPRSSKPIIG